jgi:hypothetical protein
VGGTSRGDNQRIRLLLPNEADLERFTDLSPTDRCGTREFSEVKAGTISSELGRIRGGLAHSHDDALWNPADGIAKLTTFGAWTEVRRD